MVAICKATITWLEYCRCGEKHRTINQSNISKNPILLISIIYLKARETI